MKRNRIVVFAGFGIVVLIALFVIFSKEPKSTERMRYESAKLKALLGEFVLVKGDTFLMGSFDTVISSVPSDEWANLDPNSGGTISESSYDNEWANSEVKLERSLDEKFHRVYVSTFFISPSEVTQELYEFVMGENPSEDKSSNKLPVTNVSWEDAQEFVNKLNSFEGNYIKYRLPYEAEWEFAAKGGKKKGRSKFSGSDNVDSVAWWSGNASVSLHNVNLKSPNELGLFDMSGNVSEWCYDGADGFEYNVDVLIDPKGNDRAPQKIVRGGSFYQTKEYCSVARRNNFPPQWKNYDLGFRLAYSN
jgi:formylglycine-generating enzyme required for sulfatase activity